MKFALFDAYGTLVELDQFYRRLHDGFSAHGLDLPPEIVTKAAQKEMSHYVVHTVHAKTQADWLKLKSDCAGILAETIRTQGYDLELSEECVLQILNEALVFHAFPETLEVLRELKTRGVALGVLSNWDGSLRTVLQELELMEYFDFVLISAECGLQKPQREFFEMGLAQAREKYLALLAEECIYIGDHYDGDIAGARDAGLTPVWLVRKTRDEVSGPQREDNAVLRIHDLRGLLELDI